MQQATFGDSTNVEREKLVKERTPELASQSRSTATTGARKILRAMQVEEWDKHKGMTEEESMKRYIALVTECAPDWRLGWIKKESDKERDKSSAEKALMWVLKLKVDEKLVVNEIRVMQSCHHTQGAAWFQLEEDEKKNERTNKWKGASSGRSVGDRLTSQKGPAIAYFAPLMPLTVDDLLHIASKKFENPLSQALHLARGMLMQVRVGFEKWSLATTLTTGLEVWEREVKFSPSVMMMSNSIVMGSPNEVGNFCNQVNVTKNRAKAKSGKDGRGQQGESNDEKGIGGSHEENAYKTAVKFQHFSFSFQEETFHMTLKIYPIYRVVKLPWPLTDR